MEVDVDEKKAAVTTGSGTMTLQLPTAPEEAGGGRGRAGVILRVPISICEQGPSQPSSPTVGSPCLPRRPCPLTPEAMRRIDLLTAGGGGATTMTKTNTQLLSPQSPNYATSDLGSSPRSSISWSRFRGGSGGPVTLLGVSGPPSDGGYSDTELCAKDLLSPGMMLSPAPFSPFSDDPDTPCSAPLPGQWPTSAAAGGLLLLPPSLHFSFESAMDVGQHQQQPSSIPQSLSNHFLMPPSATVGRRQEAGAARLLLAASRQRSKSANDVGSAADDDEDMTPTAATGRADQFKKRLLDKYEKEQRTEVLLPSADSSSGRGADEERERGSRGGRSAWGALSSSASSLAESVQKALSSQTMFELWLQRQLLAWQSSNPFAPPVPRMSAPPPPAAAASFPSIPLLLSSAAAVAPFLGHLPRPPFRRSPTTAPLPRYNTTAGHTTGPGPIKTWRRSRSESDVSVGVGSHVCCHCGQAFTVHDRLAKHIASRHRDRSAGQDPATGRPHHCTVCTKSFGRSDMLTRHMRLHTGHRPYGCQSCGQVFSRSDHLSTHQRTHTGEKPYQCPQCSYAASRRDMITRHMRTHNRPNSAAADWLTGGSTLQQVSLPLATLSLDSSSSPLCGRRSPLPKSPSIIRELPEGRNNGASSPTSSSAGLLQSAHLLHQPATTTNAVQPAAGAEPYT